MPDNSRKKGYMGESIASGYLKIKGYQIRTRNYKRGSGEIDIIAEKDGRIIFVEVKYRSTLSMGLPRESVREKKIASLKNAALHYITEHQLSDIDMQFDIIEIYGVGSVIIEHLENAFY